MSFKTIPREKPDLMQLYEIYKITRLKTQFRFYWDLGTFETAIIINDLGEWRKPSISDNWHTLKANEVLFCPDLIEYIFRAIIEHEEQPKPQKGARIIKKGHSEESRRDSKRDLAYERAGFLVLKIWENEDQDTQKSKILQFLDKVARAHKLPEIS
ncbi:MAG: hypothetical protein ACE5HI_01970 [bacterium]